MANISVNPARSTGPALFVGGWATAQLWLFWAAPLAGGAIGGLVYRYVLGIPFPPRQSPPRPRRHSGRA